MWAWTGFIWLRLGTRDGATVNTAMKPRFYEMWAIPRLSGELLAAEEGVFLAGLFGPVFRKLRARQASKSGLCGCVCW
jgi:hypothetical protein